MKRSDMMCVCVGGGGEVPHRSDIRLGWRSQSVKRSDMMCVCVGERGGGSTPQRHQTWMEEPVCEEV